MIERHITFSVPLDRASEFERFIVERYAPAMAAAPGNAGVWLVREADDPTRYQVAFRFQDGETAVGWRTSPVHEALQPDLKALATTVEVKGYELVAGEPRD